MLAWACYSTARPTLALACYNLSSHSTNVAAKNRFYSVEMLLILGMTILLHTAAKVGVGGRSEGGSLRYRDGVPRLGNTAGQSKPLSLSVSYFTTQQFLSVRAMSAALIWTYVSTSWRPLIPNSAKSSVFGGCDHPGSRIADPA